jgi:hypothetical protein
MRSKGFSAGLAVVVAMGFVASQASASTTIGQAPPSSGSLAPPCGPGMGLQLSVANGVDYVVPAGGGVITAWKTSLNGQVGLRVYRGSGTTWIPISEDNIFGTGDLTTFNVRTPVQGGDRIGMNIPASTPGCLYQTGLGGDVIGEAMSVPIGSNTPFVEAPGDRFNEAAVIEADADGDGFGDETQDQCPTDATTHGPCPVAPETPETTITKAPKKAVKTKKKKVAITFAFNSSVASATFSCAIDSQAPRACSSPFTTEVGLGKHTFSVVSANAGSPDPTPATATFKVKRKHKHRH